jgi:hypothetical protein
MATEQEPHLFNWKLLFDLADQLNTIPIEHLISNNASIEKGDNPLLVDVSNYFHLTQRKAAKALGVASSTLSSKWLRSSKGKGWPYRKLMDLESTIDLLKKHISDPHIEYEKRQSYRVNLVDLEEKLAVLKSPVLLYFGD